MLSAISSCAYVLIIGSFCKELGATSVFMYAWLPAYISVRVCMCVGLHPWVYIIIYSCMYFCECFNIDIPAFYPIVRSTCCLFQQVYSITSLCCILHPDFLSAFWHTFKLIKFYRDKNACHIHITVLHTGSFVCNRWLGICHWSIRVHSISSNHQGLYNSNQINVFCLSACLKVLISNRARIRSVSWGPEG